MRLAARGVKLAAREICVRVGGRMVVEGAALELAPGELVGLIGPNGAGKSSLIRALAGILPHSGEVLLDGAAAGGFTRQERARLVAYLPQERRIEWAISVREVVMLGRHPFGRSFARFTRVDDMAIDAALAAVEAGHLANRPAHALSGGETARVLLARALAVEAPLLLADEPIAALDPYHQLQVMEVLRARADAGSGVLAVLHDLALAARFCNRLVVMREGRVVGDGPPGAVLDAAMLAQVYRIEPLAGTHDGQGWVLPWRRLDVAAGEAGPGEP